MEKRKPVYDVYQIDGSFARVASFRYAWCAGLYRFVRSYLTGTGFYIGARSVVFRPFYRRVLDGFYMATFEAFVLVLVFLAVAALCCDLVFAWWWLK